MGGDLMAIPKWMFWTVTAPLDGRAFKTCDKPCSDKPEEMCPHCLSRWIKAAPSAYLSSIGSKGGKKSRRKLTKKDAKRMADARWGNRRPKKEQQP